ncbi:MAG: 16S rRNA (guanine(527)-N(7))-methyltransferase [Sulfuricurvum sp. GWF2_44_89]|uniref:Ribosomal RNA small subunit methyltransferase G n=1 Tax=Sulfuricurvum kujiense TaxID=148813 RepID=A0A2D3WJU7_9BACT|nr:MULTISPECIES: 16S rRNA (guanine(527)-N(7))-methyltransferase RsmG [Sulfuricurvum]OHD77957.1 MAG: 16S rRNA (guanine(527)-N(7))-methyltransferase [Sulfuricurvum sp. GWF2_44_89]OHD90632.1 MAG: 16S rRNA (guanine(527)-N(7))-methyltransferase [Sulfuricurvum sp. RIFOXYD12_FULL_44_77]OHD93059.1 MAG: 16S rRNA (guanine(527)-N(7))-methyltransferase [Sulfuricurvum sp. RIFOXYD2_FULL_44_160]DAB37379.1 MAG TPA: 16S rRNA (guanine(527)-N(7))-methyltransferase RsmG [Sulfuricurvum kujiense]
MSQLKQLLAQHNVKVPEDFLEKIAQYKALLEKWNKVHNLTGAKTLQQIDQFILDAVIPVTFLPSVTKAMDIGTGAGFPGMILAIALPQTHFTLVEPLSKRASFLQFVKADLGLSNVDVKALRVEQLSSEPYDLITSRAVTDTEMLLKLSKPFCSEGTLLLFYKGEKVYDEIDETLDYTIIEAENRHYLLIKR